MAAAEQCLITGGYGIRPYGFVRIRSMHRGCGASWALPPTGVVVRTLCVIFNASRMRSLLVNAAKGGYTSPPALAGASPQGEA